MKANAPEKIYISTNSQDDTYYISNQYKRLIEYTRADSFIEKACTYLDENCRRFILTEKDIDDFRNYMKGE